MFFRPFSFIYKLALSQLVFAAQRLLLTYQTGDVKLVPELRSPFG